MNLVPFSICADVHGDMQDPKTTKLFLEHMRFFKPVIRVLAGDAWEFKALRAKASDADRQVRLDSDVDEGLDFIDRYRPTVLLRGNHDERLWNLLRDGTGPAQTLAAKLIGEIEKPLDKLKCQMLPYDVRHGLFPIGHLRVCHGFFSGIYAARQHVLHFGCPMAFGHTHAIDEATVGGIKPRAGYNIGCLCQIDMDWNAAKPAKLRHEPGWAFGMVDTDSGLYWLYQAKQIGGRWMVPSTFREL